MKKFLFAILAGFIPALVATHGAYAQNSVNMEAVEPQKNGVSIENSVTPAGGHITNIAAVSPGALKDFNRTYKNVTGEIWDRSTDGFIASYTLAGVSNRIYYDFGGRWSGSLKGYNEAQMPADVRKIVKREYFDYSITYVQEAETPGSEGKPTYIVHLEDKNSIKLVRVNDGDMDEWQSYKKQSL